MYVVVIILEFKFKPKQYNSVCVKVYYEFKYIISVKKDTTFTSSLTCAIFRGGGRGSCPPPSIQREGKKKNHKKNPFPNSDISVIWGGVPQITDKPLFLYYFLYYRTNQLIGNHVNRNRKLGKVRNRRRTNVIYCGHLVRSKALKVTLNDVFHTRAEWLIRLSNKRSVISRTCK